MSATPGLFAAALVSQTPALPGLFAPPVIVPVVARPGRRAPDTARLGQRAGRTLRGLMLLVAVLIASGGVLVLGAGYAAIMIAPARVTSAGTVLAGLPAPVNALPTGSVITATVGSEVPTGAARLLHPTLTGTAQLTVIGPVSAGVALMGYATTCAAGSCTPGSVVVVSLREIAGGPDTGTSVFIWLRDRVIGG